MKKRILFMAVGFFLCGFSAYAQENTQKTISNSTSQSASVTTNQQAERKTSLAELKEKGTCTEITRPNPSDPPSSVRIHENVTRQQCDRIEKTAGIGSPLHEVKFTPAIKTENGEANNCELPVEQTNHNVKPKWRQNSSGGTSN